MYVHNTLCVCRVCTVGTEFFGLFVFCKNKVIYYTIIVYTVHAVYTYCIYTVLYTVLYMYSILYVTVYCICIYIQYIFTHMLYIYCTCGIYLIIYSVHNNDYHDHYLTNISPNLVIVTICLPNSSPEHEISIEPWRIFRRYI